LPHLAGLIEIIPVRLFLPIFTSCHWRRRTDRNLTPRPPAVPRDCKNSESTRDASEGGGEMPPQCESLCVQAPRLLLHNLFSRKSSDLQECVHCPATCSCTHAVYSFGWTPRRKPRNRAPRVIRVTDSMGLLVGAVGIETTKGRHSQGGVKNTGEYKGMNRKGEEFTYCPIVPSFF